VDTRDLFAEVAATERLFANDHVHWSAEGHRMVASALLQKLHQFEQLR
jgi:hypothetical protein